MIEYKSNFFSYFSETNLSLYPSTINSDYEDTPKLISFVTTKNNNSALRKEIHFSLNVLYYLIFYVFGEESQKNFASYFQYFQMDKNILLPNYIEYLCGNIKHTESEGCKKLRTKLYKKFFFINLSINEFLSDIYKKFTNFFNSRNFGKIESINNNFKTALIQKNKIIYYTRELGSFGLFFHYKYINNDYIKLFSIKIHYKEKDIYKKFLFNKYINEYFLKEYDIEQMIISFLIQKETYFNIIYYKCKEKNNVNIDFYNEEFFSNLIAKELEEKEKAYLEESTLYSAFNEYMEEYYNL